MNSVAPRVAVVDDDPSVSRALFRLLRAIGLNVSTYASAQEFLEQYDPDVPGCLVLDLAMPGLSGLELQDVLTGRGSSPPIIFLTGHATVSASVRALKRGAIDFLTKPVDETTLLDAVHDAIQRDRIRREDDAGRAKAVQLLASLTPRELEVLTHVVTGKLNKCIAVELGTAEKTVKVHRARIMKKMQVRSLAELVLLAADAGLRATSDHLSVAANSR